MSRTERDSNPQPPDSCQTFAVPIISSKITQIWPKAKTYLQFNFVIKKLPDLSAIGVLKQISNLFSIYAFNC